MPPVLQQAAQAQGLGPSLAAQLATLQAEAEQWEGLAGRYSSMLAPQPDTTATAVPPDSGEAVVAEQQGGSKPRGSPGSQAAQEGAGSPGVAGAVAGVAAPGGSGLAAAGLVDVTGLGSVRAAVAASMTSQPGTLPLICRAGSGKPAALPFPDLFCNMDLQQPQLSSSP
ncbi:hypothetical protein QJQ45_022336 [Haematococcus lacustris]|nr:hypothetical protein QJQ45_022336 [Haematococcus lacustris]